MDFNFSEIQFHWRKTAADFVRSCAPLPADDASGAYWLERAVADSWDAGVFDCAVALESNCAGYFFMSEQVRRSFSEALRAMPAPVGAVLIWPDANSNGSPARGTTVTLADSQLRIDEVISLAQPDTTHCLGWAPSADSKAGGAISFLASGNSVAQSIEPANVDGFRTLPVNRLSGLLYSDGPNTRIHRSEALAFAQLLASAGAERALLFAAAGIGLAQVALDYALDYSRSRMSFHKPLCQHQAVALRLAGSAPLEKLVRDMRAFDHLEGTGDIHRLMITRSMLRNSPPNREGDLAR